MKTILLCIVVISALCSPLRGEGEGEAERGEGGEEACDCKYCDGERVIGLEESKSATNSAENHAEGTICARDRDSKDRTFSSECHMQCHNRCSRYRLSEDGEEGPVKTQQVRVYRTNYYKLRDGSCE